MLLRLDFFEWVMVIQYIIILISMTKDGTTEAQKGFYQVSCFVRKQCTLSVIRCRSRRLRATSRADKIFRLSQSPD